MDSRTQAEPTKEEALHGARCIHEACYLQRLCWPFRPWELTSSSGTFGPTCDLYFNSIWRCFNKSFPIYMLGQGPVWDFSNTMVDMALMAQIQMLLQDRWFTPYESVIEWGRGIAQPIWVSDSCSPTPPGEDVGFLLEETQRISRGLSEYMLHALEEADAEDAAGIQSGREDGSGKDESAKDDSGPKGTAGKHSDVYVCQPLFQAVAITFLRPKFSYKSLRGSGIAGISCLVVATGVEDGLSAPVDLLSIWRKVQEENGSEISVNPPFFVHKGGAHAIQVSFSKAIDLMMHLEDREIAAFGIKPDPIQSLHNIKNRHHFDFSDFYTPGMDMSEEDWRKPSSEWVDVQLFHEWTGAGAQVDVSLRRYGSKKISMAITIGLRAEKEATDK